MTSRVFANESKYDADWRARKALQEVKKAAEETLHQMDIYFGSFELDAADEFRWNQLREAILQFRVLEVTPAIYEKMQHLRNQDSICFGSDVQSAQQPEGKLKQAIRRMKEQDQQQNQTS